MLGKDHPLKIVEGEVLDLFVELEVFEDLFNCSVILLLKYTGISSDILYRIVILYNYKELDYSIANSLNS